MDEWRLLRERPAAPRDSFVYQSWVLSIRLRRLGWEVVKAWRIPQLVDWLAQRVP